MKVGAKQNLKKVFADGVINWRKREIWKVWCWEKLKTVVMDGSKIEEMVESQNKKRLCKSIIKGLARHNREERVMLSEL